MSYKIEGSVIEVTFGVLLGSKALGSLGCSAWAWLEIQKLRKARALKAISLQLDRSHQPLLDKAWGTGDVPPPSPGDEMSAGMENGEPVLYARKDIGAFSLLIRCGTRSGIHFYATDDATLPYQERIEYTVKYLWDLHAQHDYVVHVCSIEVANLLKDLF